MKLIMITMVVDEEDPDLGVTIEWIQTLARQVDELNVFALRTGEYQFPENVSVHCISGENNDASRLVKLFRLWGMVSQFIFKFDGLFIHQGQIYSILVAPFFRLLGKPVVMWKTHGHVPWTMRLGLLFISRVVTANKKSFRIDTPKRIVTGHGIDVNRFQPSDQAREIFSNEDLKLLTTGRISPSKSLAPMIKVLTEDFDLKTQLTIIGEPALESDQKYLEELRSLAEELKVSNKINWRGSVRYSAIHNEVEQHDIFLNFSDTGSVDKAPLEAMALKRPVILSNVAFSDIGSLESFPYFIKRDEEDLLYENIKNWLNLSQRALNSYQEKAREWVIENHSMENLMSQVSDIFMGLGSGS